MEDIRIIEQQFRNQQERFTYYLIGLSVAAIGFSINLTYGEPFELSQILLGLSLLSFGISILHGFKYLNKLLEVLSHNITFLEEKTAGMEKNNEAYILSKIEEVRTKASVFRKNLSRFFFIGIGLFVIWHLLEMYLKTVNI